MTTNMKIRELTKADFQAFWPTFKTIIEAQETYAFAPDLSFEQAYAIWCEAPLKTWAAEQDGVILGSYYIKANAAGPGDHICNCGYMVSPQARGKGVARQMCEHSQQFARKSGFSAMQFNSVVASNTAAVSLWRKLGYTIIGTIPNAYRHKQLGHVDAFVMYKDLLVSANAKAPSR